jgi:hypothetical protein
MRLPSGDELYEKVEPTAALIKAVIQMGIGLAAMGVFAYQCISPHRHSMSLADRALSVAGGALAISAAVELAYTLFTKGPDEALDPLILGISAFALINISRHDPPLSNSLAIPVSLLALALLFLFVARRFLLNNSSTRTRPFKTLIVSGEKNFSGKSRTKAD